MDLHPLPATFTYKHTRWLIQIGLLVGLLGSLGVAAGGTATRARTSALAIGGLLLAIGLGLVIPRGAFRRVAVPARITETANSRSAWPADGWGLWDARPIRQGGAAAPGVTARSRFCLRVTAGAAAWEIPRLHFGRSPAANGGGRPHVEASRPTLSLQL